MISETTIDGVIEALSATEEALDEAIDSLEINQPVLFAYLFSEEFEAFTEPERDYLLFLALVIWQSVEKELGKRPQVTEDQLNAAEEQNWERLQGITERRFRERVSLFFDGYAEEDLLAFVEDALVEDEDSAISKEGREPLFVTLKSIIDVLSPAS